MKITKIKLTDYLHFKKGLELDLTYPKDHPTKPGAPLDKVCFLGQSGTGKTTLLNLIKYMSFERAINDSCIEQTLLKENSVEVFYHINEINFSKISQGNSLIKYLNQHSNEQSDFKLFIDSLLSKYNVSLMSFPFDVIRDIDFDMPVTNKGYTDFLSKIQSPNSKNESLSDSEKAIAAHNKIWDFGAININSLWELVFNDVKTYNEKLIKKKLELFDKIEKRKVYNNATASDLKKFSLWEKKNPNPVKLIAESGLNHFLKDFYLQVNTELDFDKLEDLKSIKIKQIDGTDVPFLFLSTGTKQIILTTLPFYILKPEKALVLYDEPERSLYPNMQIKLIEKLTTDYGNCQFFFSTHSPIVASAFEPWEVIELKFNKDDGKVYQEKYYDINKENSVKNYTINPQLLSYGNIYTDVFDLIDDGNSEFRKPELNRLATLLNELDSIRNIPNNKKKRTDKLEEIKGLASHLKVDLRLFQYASI